MYNVYIYYIALRIPSGVTVSKQAENKIPFAFPGHWVHTTKWNASSLVSIQVTLLQ